MSAVDFYDTEPDRGDHEAADVLAEDAREAREDAVRDEGWVVTDPAFAAALALHLPLPIGDTPDYEAMLAERGVRRGQADPV